MAGEFSFELTGLDAVDRLFLKLTDFDKLIRIPLSAAGGEAKKVMAAEVGSRKAARAMKVRVRKDAAGLTATIGPAGGSNRAGFLAALLLEKGTGLYGPKKRRIVPQRGKAFAIPSQALANERFGPSAQLFTKTGRLAARGLRAYGNAAFVVVRSTAGAPPRPWYDRAVRQALPRVQEAFSSKLSETLGG